MDLGDGQLSLFMTYQLCFVKNESIVLTVCLK